jgi:hypothetical protein
MLDRATRIRWTQDVVAFLNRDTDGSTLGRDPALANLLRGDLKWQRRAPPEKLRGDVERELRWFAEQLDEKRAKARKEQWPAEDRERKIRVRDDVRRTHGDFWLDAEARARADDASFIAALNYDEKGQIVMRPGGECAPEVVIALTIAELLSSDSPVEVKVCHYEKCTRLFVHELHGDRRPKEYCRVQHSVAQRKWRMKKRKRKRK